MNITQITCCQNCVFEMFLWVCCVENRAQECNGSLSSEETLIMGYERVIRVTYEQRMIFIAVIAEGFGCSAYDAFSVNYNNHRIVLVWDCK